MCIRDRWYRKKRKAGNTPLVGTGQGKGRKDSNNKTVPTRTVLFVEYTPGGNLAKELRDVLAGIEHILGFRVKVVERSGTAIARKFPLTQLWEGQPCGRLECVTCLQGGEKVPPCTKRNLTYENICILCNPKAVEGKAVVPTSSVPSIYVGESWRSLAERGREHLKAYKAEKEDSHMYKHHQVHHGGVGTPKFHLRPLKFHRTALERQVAEAVRIKWRGGEDCLLNSRAEFNRCKIQRLSLPPKEVFVPPQPGLEHEEARLEEGGVEQLLEHHEAIRIQQDPGTHYQVPQSTGTWR